MLGAPSAEKDAGTDPHVGSYHKPFNCVAATLQNVLLGARTHESKYSLRARQVQVFQNCAEVLPSSIASG